MHLPKLGKRPARIDRRTLRLEQYLNPAQLPPLPDECSWADKIPAGGWPMMANDQLGDCTCAAAGHMIEAWTANTGQPFTPADADIVAAYSAVSGYNPQTGANDDGAVELDVLNYWRQHGIAGHPIAAYVAIDPRNVDHVRAAIYLFGGIYIGLSLPLSAQNQRVWSVPFFGAWGHGSPGSWGGHAVPNLAYDANGMTCVTWGALMRMTWAFFHTYCDEAYAVLSADWINQQAGKSPAGFDLATLEADLNEV